MPTSQHSLREHKKKAVELLGGKCVICGTVERLEFDHINNDRKDFNHCISVLTSSSWGRVERELEKCQLLCRHCHHKKSLLERGYDLSGRHGLMSTYVKKKCRCDKCRASVAMYMREWRSQKRLAKVN